MSFSSCRFFPLGAPVLVSPSANRGRSSLELGSILSRSSREARRLRGRPSNLAPPFRPALRTPPPSALNQNHHRLGRPQARKRRAELDKEKPAPSA